MYPYKVFTQLQDNDFVEIAQTSTERDADNVLAGYSAGMVTCGGTIVTTKNLHHGEVEALPGL